MSKSDSEMEPSAEPHAAAAGDASPPAPPEAKSWDDVNAEIKRASEAAKKAAENFLAAAKKTADEEISPEARAALLASAVGLMRGFQKTLKSEADRIEEMRLTKQVQPNEAPPLATDDPGDAGEA